MAEKPYDCNDDSALIEEYKRGNEYALTLLYNKYFSHAKRFFESDKLTRPDAEDFAQEVFLKITRAILVCDISNFKKFFYTALLNRKKDAIRKKYRNNFVVISIFDEVFSEKSAEGREPVVLDTLRISVDTPFTDIRFKELKRIVQECIEAFHDEKRRLIVSLKIQGYRENQIAEVMNINPHTVNSNWGRGKIQLRDCVSKRLERIN
ncbi:sigma-70 family RNA polymerase sigma factor [candidate division KSB1 bacterium]|nr:sigma-70 family RNA polymerase sigma factor [candidate division KSB1 bacterium]